MDDIERILDFHKKLNIVNFTITFLIEKNRDRETQIQN